MQMEMPQGLDLCSREAAHSGASENIGVPSLGTSGGCGLRLLKHF
jgi:hypothetical protein